MSIRWILCSILCLSTCLALPLVPPPTYRLYNSTLLELNTTTPLDLNATVVGLSCNGNSSMSLTALATGIARVTGNTDPAAQRLFDAVLANPWGIDGEGRDNTRVIESLGALARGVGWLPGVVVVMEARS